MLKFCLFCGNFYPKIVLRIGVLILERSARLRSSDEDSWPEKVIGESSSKQFECPTLPVITVSKVQVPYISRITNISHRSGWSTGQPVELLHQPDNSWPLLQSQSSCAAETEGHSRHLLQVLLLTPLLCSTENSWRCNEEKLLQERYNANL